MPLANHTTPANGDELAQVLSLLDAVKVLLGRGTAAMAYAPLPYSDELQQQISQARELVSAHFDALADEAIEDGGAGAKRVGLSRHYH